MLEEKKIEAWQRKLLDLSLRNSLLNFRIKSSGVPLLIPDVFNFEDSIADGANFNIIPCSPEWDYNLFDADAYAKDETLLSDINKKRIHSFSNETELNSRLTLLYRNSRLSLEESGANTLFLAIGFLVWHEEKSAGNPRYAPIILVPAEIVRKSIQTGFVVRARDEETQINITLLEMLKQDFAIDASSLNTLPADEKGADVQMIFAMLEKLTAGLPGWSILKSVHLGLFSFNKFVMWNDLHARSADLKRNKVVNSLMNGRLQWQPERVDENIDSDEVLSPISADSSQLAAIYAAAKGRSFILHGPPGTGKSQTITNIIANAMANGKTVLFAAEKMAALKVVQNRLARIGLDPFCLEIYSNKSKKRDVLEQLRAASENDVKKEAKDWESETIRLSTLKNELNSFAKSMHIGRNPGYSIYEAISRYTLMNGATSKIKFKTEQIDEMNAGTYKPMTECAHRLAVAGKACAEPSANPWKGIGINEYSISLKENVLNVTDSILEILLSFKNKLSQVFDIFAIRPKNLDYSSVKAVIDICGRLTEGLECSGDIFSRPDDFSALFVKSDEIIANGSERDRLKTVIFAKYADSVLTLNLKTLLEEAEKADKKWLFPKQAGRIKIKKHLAEHLMQGQKIKGAQLTKDLSDIIAFAETQQYLDGQNADLMKYFPKTWNMSYADWTALKNQIETVNSILTDAAGISGFELNVRIAEIVNAKENHIEFREITGLFNSIHIKWNELDTLLSFEFGIDLPDKNGEDIWTGDLETLLKGFHANIDGFKDYCHFLTVRSEAENMGMNNILELYAAGNIFSSEIEFEFEKGFLRTWIENELSKDKILSSFVRSEFEDKIEMFRKLDEKYAELTRKQIYSKIKCMVPDMMTESVASSEPGILQRAIRSQGRGIPLRRLFETIPNILLRMKPCFLMSPLSVAQYLDPKFPEFDLVIFDEASQMPTFEAVGAMARGRDVIVVGDPNQLPPTTFFTSQNFGDDDETDLELLDLESTLDDCLALNLPQLHLAWHYRSNHESLISFSNSQYYENKLITFPSPDDMVSRVSFRFTEGIYDRGGTKQNAVEAKAVVDEIFRRLADPVLSKKTIGVVTFSLPQQTLIEDLADERLKNAPEFEKFFILDENESVFIKNLENVQGDERDVILFSICYGPDAQGKIAMNFGPVNRDGGWRRLNVAVSRARSEMIVFSSIQPDDINMSNTNARGVSELKAFLDYAKRGKAALDLRRKVSAEPQEMDGFRSAVVAELHKKGYEVNESVGYSKYKIDIAVVDKDDKEKYILAVQCDGANYAGASNARDRDKLRFEVLSNLGWNIHRIWILDWLEKPREVITGIENAILQAKNKSNEETENATAAPEESNSVSYMTDSGNDEINRRAVYENAVLYAVNADEGDFLQKKSKKTISDQIKTIISKEAPISRALLTEKILLAWSIPNTNSVIENSIDVICKKMGYQETRTLQSVFFWAKERPVEEFEIFRVPETDELRRNSEDLPKEEIAIAVLSLMEKFISIPPADLIRETARLFGYQRTGPVIEQYIRAGLDYAVEKGYVIQSDDGKILANK